MSRRASLGLVVVTLLLTSSCAAKRAPSSPPFARVERCDGPEYRKLDFWLGEWIVETPAGGLEGRNRIVSTLGGCAIEEHWTEATRGEGTSLFHFDRALGAWKQVWVTSEGGFKEKREVAPSPDMPADSIRFQGEVPRPSGGVALDRTTLTKLAGGRVRQVIEQSIDGGATWTRWEGIYVHPKPPAACTEATHRALDFWLGEWDLVVRTRKSPESEEWSEAIATNHVSTSLGGCVVEEDFRAGGVEPWAGRSLSIFSEGKWRQTWVDDQGSYLTFVGGPVGSDFVLTGEPKTKDGVTKQMRMVFFDITRDVLSWRWERTLDGGATWRVMMTITYRRSTRARP